MELRGPITVGIVPAVKRQGYTALVASVMWGEAPEEGYTVTYAGRVPGQHTTAQQARIIAERCLRIPGREELRLLIDVTKGGQSLADGVFRELAGDARVVQLVLEEGDGLDWHAQPVRVGADRLVERLAELKEAHLLDLAAGVTLHPTDAPPHHALALCVLGDPYYAPIPVAATRTWQQDDPEYQAEQEAAAREHARLEVMTPTERAEALRQAATLRERDRAAAERVQRSLDWLRARCLF